MSKKKFSEIHLDNDSHLEEIQKLPNLERNLVISTREDLVVSHREQQRSREIRWFHLSQSILARCAYHFDNFISYGPMSMLLLLICIFFIALIFCTFLYGLFGDPGGFLQRLWQTFIQLCDPGYLDASTPKQTLPKIVSVMTAMLGVVIFSTLIAFLTSALNQKLQDLKKGHSAVLEKNHTLILGWNDKVVSIIAELIIANESEKRAVVVILSSRPKEELEDFLRSMLPTRYTTRIIVRSGEISNLAHLEKVAIDYCKSVIITGEIDKNAQYRQRILGDTQIIKTVLSICKNPQRREPKFNIVTETYNNKNLDIVKSVGEDEVTILFSDEIIAKILVQTSRQNGLAAVYSELLSFTGNEIYFVAEPRVHGKKFIEILFDFPCCIPIGIKKSGKMVELNPPLETMVETGDQIIVVAEDDSAISYRKNTKYLPPAISSKRLRRRKRAERQLILGWNSRTGHIIKEYLLYLGEGSHIHVVLPEIDEEVRLIFQNLQEQSASIRLTIEQRDYRSLDELDIIKPFTYNNIIILASEHEISSSMEEIDSQTIYTLLLLRNMQKQQAISPHCKLITELLNPSNQELIQIAKANDFVISDQLVSMMFAQVSEQKFMYEVYHDLFRSQGSEIYLKPAHVYFSDLPRQLSFQEIMLAGLQYGEIAFGYRITQWSEKAHLNYGIKINPEKDKKIFLDEQDYIITLVPEEK